MTIQNLIEDYKNRISTISVMLIAECEKEELNEKTITRLSTKASCYRTFLAELNQAQHQEK